MIKKIKIVLALGCALFLAALIGLFFYKRFRVVEQQPVFVGKRLLIVCDMWEDEIGGVSEIVNQVRDRLSKKGYVVKLMGLKEVNTFKVPFVYGTDLSYPWGVKKRIHAVVTEFKPDYIFVVLRGALSHIAGSYCEENNIPFTAFYSMRLPECMKLIAGVPKFFSRPFINNFLSKASRIIVPSDSMRHELVKQKFKNVISWPHGIDINYFVLPTEEDKKIASKLCHLENKERPFYLYVGRISKEKNITAFLETSLPGTKIVVGPEYSGIKIEDLKRQYPDVIFTGPQRGKNLINYYQSADIFFFPSKVDSFGIVMLEALASGLPVVGFNTVGPKDVAPIGCGVSYLANNDVELRLCALQAWKDLELGKILPSQCRDYASMFSWDVAMATLEAHFIQI